jgi:(2Fe-2S) ferredoxin
MNRLNSIAELQDLSRTLAKTRDPRRQVVSLCNTGCAASGSQEVCNAFISEIEKKGLADKVEVKLTGCHGFCEQGPVCVIYPKKIFYKQLQPEDVPEIVDETLIRGRVVRRLLWTNPESGRKIVGNDDVIFYAKQYRQVLEKNGLIDPTSIEDCLATGGYGALAKVLGSMTPDQVRVYGPFGA